MTQLVKQGNLPTISDSGSGLNKYLKEIAKFPMLQPQEEYMLGKRYQEHGDTEAAHKLVTSHLRLVAKIAMGYRGYGLPVGEVISEGNIGLMQAVKKFDPDRGFKLATYAMWWIKASIQEYILRSWSLVKIGTTAAQKRLFFNLKRVKNQIEAADEGTYAENVKEIAKRLDVSEDDVMSMDARLTGDSSLNAPLTTDEGSAEWQDWLVDDSPSQEKVMGDQQDMQEKLGYLAEAMNVLNERERYIFEARRLAEPPKTLEQLSQEFEISRERVRQIEVRAFEKVQEAVQLAAAEKLASQETLALESA